TGADAIHLDINASGFGEGSFNIADIGDLAADVKMHELKAIGHVALLEIFERFEHFRERQAELRAETRARFPPSGAAGRQLDAHADRRPDIELLAVADDRLELGELLDDRNYLLADFSSEHRHFDEFIVFESVTHNGRVGCLSKGKHGQKLRLRAGFNAEVIRLAEIEDFFDDMPLLIDL